MKKPTVTQIIGYFNPATDYMNDDSALKFGSAVHETTRLFDKKNLNESTLDKHLKPYLVGYKKFLDDYNPEFNLIEKRFYNDLFTGRIDRAGIIQGKQMILDIKTGGIQKGACGLQLAAYTNLINISLELSSEYIVAKTPKIDIGYIVNLKEDSYSIAWYPFKELRRYYVIFNSMLNTYNFIKNGFKL